MTRDVKLLHPHVQALCKKHIAECKKVGIPIVVTGTLRTMEEQAKLYAQGRTTKGNIVTNAEPGESMHNYGLAYDVCIGIKGREWDVALLNKAGAIGQKLGLTWGGTFRGLVDTPHFQWTDGLTIKELKAGKRPKEVFKNEKVVSK